MRYDPDPAEKWISLIIVSIAAGLLAAIVLVPSPAW